MTKQIIKRKHKIIVTGTGYRSSDRFSESENIFQSENIKVNIGAATAKYLVEKGFDIVLLSRTEDKLKKIQTDLKKLFPQVDI